MKLKDLIEKIPSNVKTVIHLTKIEEETRYNDTTEIPKGYLDLEVCFFYPISNFSLRIVI